jgi:hypothetical protein
MSHKAVSNEPLFLGDSETATGPDTEPKHREVVPSGNLIDDAARAESGKHRNVNSTGEPGGPGDGNGQSANPSPHGPDDPEQPTDEAEIP